MSGTHRLLKGGGDTALIAECQYCWKSEFPPLGELNASDAQIVTSSLKNIDTIS